MSDEPEAAGEQGDLVSRLRAVIGAKDEQIAVLTAALEAALDRERRLELRLAEAGRRLSMDSTDSGTPSPRERTGAKEARRARQQSGRERRKDRKRGGQPGHRGKGLERDPDPGEKQALYYAARLPFRAKLDEARRQDENELSRFRRATSQWLETIEDGMASLEGGEADWAENSVLKKCG